METPHSLDPDETPLPVAAPDPDEAPVLNLGGGSIWAGPVGSDPSELTLVGTFSDSDLVTIPAPERDEDGAWSWTAPADGTYEFTGTFKPGGLVPAVSVLVLRWPTGFRRVLRRHVDRCRNCNPRGNPAPAPHARGYYAKARRRNRR